MDYENTKAAIKVKKFLKKAYEIAKLVLKWVTVIPIAIEFIIKYIDKKGN